MSGCCLSSQPSLSLSHVFLPDAAERSFSASHAAWSAAFPKLKYLTSVQLLTSATHEISPMSEMKGDRTCFP